MDLNGSRARDCRDDPFREVEMAGPVVSNEKGN
jgi:hypothetical protein